MIHHPQDNLSYVLEHFLVHHQAADITLTSYKADEVLVEEGKAMDHLTILLSGKAKVIKNYENGKRLLIQFIRPINFVGDVEYVTRQSAFCTVVATEDIVCFSVPFTTLDAQYRDNMTFQRFLLDQICYELLQSSDRNSLNLIYPVKTRLASYLLSTMDETHTCRIAHMHDLSDYLGTSYRHLTRSINALIHGAVIQKVKKTIHIIDSDALMRIARGNIYENNEIR